MDLGPFYSQMTSGYKFGAMINKAYFDANPWWL